MKAAAAVMLAVIALSSTGCEPTWKKGGAVRRTLDAQAKAVEPPPELREKATAAHKALATWQSDLALALDVSVDDTEAEIGRAWALSGKNELAYRQAMQIFSSAVDIITRSSGPMDRDGAQAVADLLESSAEMARDASDPRATATSPQNSLKALRTHQQNPKHFEHPHVPESGN